MSVVTPYDVEEDSRFRDGQRWPWILLAVMIIVLLILGGSFLWVKRQLDPPGAPGAEVRVKVEQGMSVSEIGDLLAKEGVITNATVFRYYARLQGADDVQAGDYLFHKRESMSTVLDILQGGAAEEEGVRVIIPEGLTLQQIADKVGELPGRSAERFLEVAESGAVRSQYQPPGSTNLEGLVLPETYFLRKDDDEQAILQRMVSAFDESATSLGITSAAARHGMSPYEVAIVASLVEREAKVPQDRGKIAQVIHNRLDNGMRLQIDATIQYALGSQKEKLLTSDTLINSPYNTYLIDGLPPTPIASPGQAALEAAVRPDPGPWLFFVIAEADGTHAFAVTLAEHNRNVASAQSKGLL